MHPVLNSYLADAFAADRLREAERFRRSRVQWTDYPDTYTEVTVRLAQTEDAARLLRLAELDGRPVPAAPVLVAEVRGELLAARSLAGEGAIADPFHPTAHLTELLELRSAHLRNGSSGRDTHRRGARGWLRLLGATTRP